MSSLVRAAIMPLTFKRARIPIVSPLNKGLDKMADKTQILIDSLYDPAIDGPLKPRINRIHSMHTERTAITYEAEEASWVTNSEQEEPAIDYEAGLKAVKAGSPGHSILNDLKAYQEYTHPVPHIPEPRYQKGYLALAEQSRGIAGTSKIKSDSADPSTHQDFLNSMDDFDQGAEMVEDAGDDFTNNTNELMVAGIRASKVNFLTSDNLVEHLPMIGVEDMHAIIVDEAGCVPKCVLWPVLETATDKRTGKLAPVILVGDTNQTAPSKNGDYRINPLVEHVKVSPLHRLHAAGASTCFDNHHHQAKPILAQADRADQRTLLSRDCLHQHPVQ